MEEAGIYVLFSRNLPCSCCFYLFFVIINVELLHWCLGLKKNNNKQNHMQII